MKGISRIDSKSTHGWFVRVYRDSKVHAKFFSDGVHRGREAALQIACAYRDSYERENPPNHFSRRVYSKRQRNNKSGVTGVSETHGRARGGRGEKMPCFNVSWNPYPGVARSKKFYVSKYDDREAALNAAIEFRKAREVEILQSITNAKQHGDGNMRL